MFEVLVAGGGEGSQDGVGEQEERVGEEVRAQVELGGTA